ncbi:hypothetical protein PM082_023256 [Marasmius tenuissimus]|nr:hypothetical protein PM082_023256 [Marasmius tenuissimus]
MAGSSERITKEGRGAGRDSPKAENDIDTVKDVGERGYIPFMLGYLDTKFFQIGQNCRISGPESEHSEQSDNIPTIGSYAQMSCFNVDNKPRRDIHDFGASQAKATGMWMQRMCREHANRRRNDGIDPGADGDQEYGRSRSRRAGAVM